MVKNRKVKQRKAEKDSVVSNYIFAFFVRRSCVFNLCFTFATSELSVVKKNQKQTKSQIDNSTQLSTVKKASYESFLVGPEA